jgi:transposase
MNSAEIIQDYENKNRILEEKNISLTADLTAYQKRCEQYALAYDQLQHQLKELLRNRFGKKSERFIDPEHPQLSLLEDNAHLFAEADAKGDAIKDEIQVSSHTRKKKKSGKELPRRIEIIPATEEQMRCPCGCQKTVIRYETKEVLNYQPAVFEIIEQRREVVACKNGCDGAIMTAPAPLQVLPKISVSESFLSFLVISKLDDRQPLYHLEKQLNERHGVDCSRQSMAGWMIDLMAPMQPLYNLFKDQVIEYDVSACDATTLQVLDEPGRKAETKSYMYCMRGGSPGKEVVLYEYNDREHKKFVADWFNGFQGYLHVDGDNFFEDMPDMPGVILVNCNAHGRRKFEPIAQSAKGKGLAKEAMRRYKELYRIERKAKDGEMSPATRYELRQKESKPLMESFKKWLDEIFPTVLPQSPLGKAIRYHLNRWPGLMRFLDDGRLEIDNNLTEQKIKPIVIARKNFLFAASVAGARALCMHFSLIQTAKLHGHDPYHYYVIVLKRLPHCKTVEDYEKLLPWNMNPDGSHKNNTS